MSYANHFLSNIPYFNLVRHSWDSRDRERPKWGPGLKNRWLKSMRFLDFKKVPLR